MDTSCPASTKIVPSTGWGGARNSAARTSDSISLSAAYALILAARQAVRIGLPLNRHVAIHWGLAGLSDDQGMLATARFLTLARDWLRKQEGEFAWTFARENGDGKGEHVHILMHVPPHLGVRFGQRQRRWIKKIVGQNYKTGTIRTRRIGGSLRAAWRSPEIYLINLGAVVAYLLKGVTDPVGRQLGVSALEAGGRVIGKRTGSSENLGAAAIARSVGWVFLPPDSDIGPDNGLSTTTSDADNQLSSRWAMVAGRIRRFSAFERLFRLP